MELLYLWIENYRNIEKQGFNFSPEWEFDFDVKSKELTVKKKEGLPKNFWGENISNVTAIVGSNGVGKTSVIDFLTVETYERDKNNQKSFILIFKTEESNTLQLRASPDLFGKVIHPKDIEVQANIEVELFSERKSFEVQKIANTMLYTMAYSPYLSLKSPAHLWGRSEYLYDNYNDWYEFVGEEIKLKVKFFKDHLYNNELNTTFRFLKEKDSIFNIIENIELSIKLKDEIQELKVLVEAENKIIEQLKTLTSKNNEESVKELNMLIQEDTSGSIIIDKLTELVKADLSKIKLIDKLKKLIDDEVSKVGVKSHHKKIKIYDETIGFWDKEKPTRPTFGTLKELIIVDMLCKINFDRGDHDLDDTFQAYKKLKLFKGNRNREILEECEYVHLFEDIVDEPSQSILRETIEVLEIMPEYYEMMEGRGAYGSFQIKLKGTDEEISFLEKLSKTKIGFRFFDFEMPAFSSGEESLFTLLAYICARSKESVEKYENENNAQAAYFSENLLLMIDEGTAGFHPQWQKQYLNILLGILGDKKLFPKKVQIILTTHSPLILSDLPKSNIVFMEKDKSGKAIVVPGVQKQNTFGANIHTLLSDAFFLKDGLVGAFAKEKINKVIKQLNAAIQPKKDSSKGEQIYDQEEQEKIRKIIDMIGEPIIQQKLNMMYDEAFRTQTELEFIEKQMAYLEKRKNELKDD
jgi:predicted ATP-dependent endonuclease of OLD family